MKNKIWFGLILILAIAPQSGLARNSKLDFESRLNSLENKINSTLNFEIASKLDFLQKELQELRGILEEQQHIIHTLTKQNTHPLKTPDNNKVNAENEVNKVLNTKEDSILPDQNAYNAAYTLIEKQQFKAALMAFKDFLLQYKDSKYTPNAIYWVGDLYLMDHKLDLAANYFLQIPEKFKYHDKSPDALLKLGQLEIERGNYTAAKDYFLTIKNHYKNSSRACLAQKKLDELEREGH